MGKVVITKKQLKLGNAYMQEYKNKRGVSIIIERIILSLVFLFRIDGDLYENDMVFAVAIALSFLGTVLVLIRIKKHNYFFYSYIKWQVLFVGFSSLSYFWAYDQSITKTFIIALIGRFIVLSFFWIYLSRTDDLEFFIKSFVIVVIISSLHLTSVYGLGRFLASRTQDLGNINEGWNSNTVSTTYSLGIFLYLYLFYIRGEGKKRNNSFSVFEIITAPFLLLVLVVIFFCASKTGLFFLFVPLLLFYILSHKNRISSVLVVAITCLIVYFLMMNVDFLYYVIGNRIESFIDGFIRGKTGLSISDQTRMNLINGGIQWFLMKPFTGWGLANFRSLMNTNLYSHNNYVEQLVSTGIVGLCVYYSAYVYLLIMALRHKKDNWAKIVLSLIVTLMIVEYGFVSYLAMQMQIVLILCLYACKQPNRGKTHKRYKSF